MKKKKLFVCMLTVLATAICAGLISCNKENTPSAVVEIQQESEVLNVLGETTLDVLTENTTADVVWTSSDESVATVRDGVVVALNVGTVTITATVNGVSDSCTIQVVRSTEAPVIQVSKTEISIDKNGEYTVKASVKWLGEDVTDKVDLTWSLGAGAQEGVAMITPKGKGEAVIKGVAVGETEYYVFATIGDAYVNQKIAISVCDSSVWFDSDTLSVGDNGKFLLQMNAIDEDGNVVAVDVPSIQAYRDDAVIPDAQYTWSSANEDIVKIEDGKIVAQRAGTADVYGVYEGNQVTVTVCVDRLVMSLEEEVVFEVADLQSVRLNTTITDSGKVYLQEKEIGVLNDGKITLDASTLPTTSKDLGAQEITIHTDKGTYNLTANLYSMLIENAQDLDAWHSYAFANGDDGYYALANNISYNAAYTGSRNWDKSGYAWANPDGTGFRGVFDGKGYTIEGLRIEEGFRGFVTLLQSEGVIKNVAFTDVSYSAIGGFLCTWGCGTIENVYVQYAANAKTGYVDKNTSLGGVFMAADNSRNMMQKMKIRNCFIDASKTTLTSAKHSYIGGYMKYDKTEALWYYDGAYAQVNDVYVVGSTTLTDGTEAKLHYNDLVVGSANYGLYPSVSAMAADTAVQAIIAGWDKEFWGVKDGVPTPARIIELGDPVKVDLPSDSKYYIFEGSSMAYPGKDYTFSVSATNANMTSFTVLVDGKQVTATNGVYTVKNVRDALDIDVVHGYIEVSGNNKPSATYDKATDTWTLTRAVLASYPGVREHGSAYISKEYIEYMIEQGYKKVQFTMQPDGQYAMQACYKYNGTVYLATKTAGAALVSLDLTVASELEFWGQNGSGSGSAIKETDCYIKVSGLVFSK